MSEEPKIRMFLVPQVPLSEEELQLVTAEPDWIVFRPADGVPPEALPPTIDGWWVDRYNWPVSGTMIHQNGAVLRFAPTGRFETREDGAVAEVFEVRL